MKKLRKMTMLAIVSVVVLVIMGILSIQNLSDDTNITDITDAELRDQVIAIFEGGIDYKDSLFPPEDEVIIDGKIAEALDSIKQSDGLSAETVINMAHWFQGAKDYDHALELFFVAEKLGFADLDYRIEIARIYMIKEQWEQARKILEPMKKDWPVAETYWELAESYKHIEGTPDYVVDDIYKEGIYRNSNHSTLVVEYVDWLEETERFAETIEYYEILNGQVPSEEYANKIAELKEKYGDE